MIGSMDHPKAKLSITLDSELVALVDRAAAREASSRSAVIEHWLWRASRLEAEARLREATIQYYESLSKSDLREDRALGGALSRASRRVRFDD
jgi:metal-responsive CopG/Arc/MetJ family transcriptional regulator